METKFDDIDLHLSSLFTNIGQFLFHNKLPDELSKKFGQTFLNDLAKKSLAKPSIFFASASFFIFVVLVLFCLLFRFLSDFLSLSNDAFRSDTKAFHSSKYQWIVKKAKTSREYLIASHRTARCGCSNVAAQFENTQVLVPLQTFLLKKLRAAE